MVMWNSTDARTVELDVLRIVNDTLQLEQKAARVELASLEMKINLLEQEKSLMSDELAALREQVVFEEHMNAFEATSIDKAREVLKQDIATKAAENNGNLLLTEPVAKLQDNTFLVGIEAVQELTDIDGKYYQRSITLYYDCGINLCYLHYFRVNADNFDEYDRDFLDTFIRSSVTEKP